MLDEPSGGLDPDGLARLTAEIARVAGESSVVLVARHPTAPLPLPAGPIWRVEHGVVRIGDRAVEAAPSGLLEVTTGDGVTRQVSESDLPAVLRAALDADLAIRAVRPAAPAAPAAPIAAGRPRRRRSPAPRPHPTGPASWAGWSAAPATAPGCSPPHSGSSRPRCCS